MNHRRTWTWNIVAGSCVAALALGLTFVVGDQGVASAGSKHDKDRGHSSSHDHNHGTKSGNQSQALETLGNNCKGSELEPHNGFQEGPRCVSTAFGEVAEQDKNPSLLIVDSPNRVRVGEAFELKVSTRNLVRDRFLGAAAGGYYLESAFLNGDGITRGHFHTACRMVGGLDEAPDPERQAIFVATEDGKGGVDPDTVTVKIAGLPERGTAQCAVWAGDGSHRIPMMQFANQIPAFDAVRIEVKGKRDM